MKSTPEGRGNTIAGELSEDRPPKALPREPRELSEAEKRVFRRCQTEPSPSGEYGIVKGDDGKLRTTKGPA